MKLFYDPAVEPTAGDFAALTKSVESVITKASEFVTKSEVAGLENSINELSASIKVGKDNIEEDPNGGFKNVGEFASVLMKACDPRGGDLDKRLKYLTKAGEVTQGYDPSVGFLFPVGFMTDLAPTFDKADNLLSGTKRLPIDASQQYVELTLPDDTDRTDGIAGGVTAYWKDELTQMTNTRPKVRQLRLEPHELYAYAIASDKSLRNAPIALGAYLQSTLVDAVNFKIGDSVINGDGVAKPLGLLASPSAISVTKETSQTAATINEANIAKMWKRMPANLRSSAVWLCNQDVEDQFDLMGRAAIGVTATVNPAIDTVLYNRSNGTLKGRPVIFTEFCQTLGTAGDIILWHPGSYYTATKAGQGPEMSVHIYFDYAKTAFRFIFEVDGKSKFNTVITPKNGNTTRSDIVYLQTRS